MIGPSDPLGWARQPRSTAAIRAVFELSTKDRSLRAIWAALVAAGVATADGKPLAIWDGGQWVTV
ncbi:hypothetical protein [Accumulibacter sp.]|uniref:hypothetical protein n=1 Tax=Accumulibacter sp. TaxID=2053492 RepID=UPI0026316B08|nr:hypothetical protein [Accumulibacter sp.]